MWTTDTRWPSGKERVPMPRTLYGARAGRIVGADMSWARKLLQLIVLFWCFTGVLVTIL
jgi:hypothetical protein